MLCKGISNKLEKNKRKQGQYFIHKIRICLRQKESCMCNIYSKLIQVYVWQITQITASILCSSNSGNKTLLQNKFPAISVKTGLKLRPQWPSEVPPSSPWPLHFLSSYPSSTGWGLKGRKKNLSKPFVCTEPVHPALLISDWPGNRLYISNLILSLTNSVSLPEI